MEEKTARAIRNMSQTDVFLTRSREQTSITANESNYSSSSDEEDETELQESDEGYSKRRKEEQNEISESQGKERLPSSRRQKAATDADEGFEVISSVTACSFLVLPLI